MYFNIYTTLIKKILLFSKNNLKKYKKSFSKRSKGGNGQAPPIGNV
jgi:hypothetical protein